MILLSFLGNKNKSNTNTSISQMFANHSTSLRLKSAEYKDTFDFFSFLSIDYADISNNFATQLTP